MTNRQFNETLIVTNQHVMLCFVSCADTVYLHCSALSRSQPQQTSRGSLQCLSDCVTSASEVRTLVDAAIPGEPTVINLCPSTRFSPLEFDIGNEGNPILVVDNLDITISCCGQPLESSRPRFPKCQWQRTGLQGTTFQIIGSNVRFRLANIRFSGLPDIEMGQDAEPFISSPFNDMSLPPVPNIKDPEIIFFNSRFSDFRSTVEPVLQGTVLRLVLENSRDFGPMDPPAFTSSFSVYRDNVNLAVSRISSFVFPLMNLLCEV